MSRTRIEFLRKLVLFGFHGLFFTVPFFFTWVNEELFEFNKMLLTYGFTTWIVSFWLIYHFFTQDWSFFKRMSRFKSTPFDLPIFLFLVSQVLSTIFSIHPHTSFFGYYTRFHGGLLSTISYILLFYAFVDTVQKKDLPGLFLSNFISAIGVSLYGILEHFGHSLSCSLITQGANNGVDCWIQDVKSRVFATFGQPNWLAAYAITLIPVSWSLAIWPPAKTHPLSKYLKWVSILAGATLILALLYTRSRSGFVGFGVSAGLFVLGLLALQLKFKTLSSSLRLTGVLALVALSITLIAGTPYSKPLQDMIAARSETEPATQTEPVTPAPAVNRLDEGGTDSGDIRKIVWTGAWKVYQRYPLLGSGLETFAYSYYLDRPVEHNLVSEWDFLYNKAHNEFLNILATTGALGLGTYLLWWLWFSLTVIIRIFRKDTLPQAGLSLGLLAGLSAVHISNFFGFSTVMVGVLMWIYPSIWLVDRQEKPEAQTPKPTTEVTWLGVIGITIAALWSWSIIIGWWQADASYARSKAYTQQGDYLSAITDLENAIKISPDEGLWYEQLSLTYGQAAAGVAQAGEATAAAQLAQISLAASDKSMSLNSVNLNFYRTRSRVFLLLATFQPEFYFQALETLDKAQTLAPTDAKIMYNRALINWELKRYDVAEQLFKTTLTSKSNYEQAHVSLGDFYAEKKATEAAMEQYNYVLEHISPNNPTVLQKIEQLKQGV